ncbi:MAG: Fe-S cluster assembly ATPase SufC [Acidimicrobiales bacterium]
MTSLVVRDLAVAVSGVEILHGVDLAISSGEVHAVMGPNGAGKSTLGFALMGHPDFEVIRGAIELDGTDIVGLPAWRRSELGLFLAFQHPIDLPGVSLEDLIVEGSRRGNGPRGDRTVFRRSILEEAASIGLSVDVAERPVNVGASGGERKRLETLQLATLKPRIALLDELDSGLDIDAMRDVARRVERMVRDHNGTHEALGVLAITHYNRLLTELRPDFVHVLVRGRIVESGGPQLAEELERSGYEGYVETVPESVELR